MIGITATFDGIHKAAYIMNFKLSGIECIAHFKTSCYFPTDEPRSYAPA